MSEKTSKLADMAVSDKKVPKKKVTKIPAVIVHVPVSRRCKICPADGATAIVYPPNPADQLHGLSVAEMVRNGQGQLLDDDLSHYDFIDQQRENLSDDGSLDVQPMSAVEWADPAEIYEAGVALEKEIRKGVVKVEPKAVTEPTQNTSISEENNTENK